MIISVFSPKGGVGKTTLVLSMAQVSGENQKTCAVEYDFSPGSFAPLLDIGREKNILEAAHGGLKYAIQRPHGKSFDVITGGYPDTCEMIESEELKNVFSKLRDMYKLVIVDMQPTFIEGHIDIFRLSDIILIVVEDEISVTSRVLGSIDWAKKSGFIETEKIAYIVNKQKGKLNYINTTDIKFPILHTIPYIANLNRLGDKRFDAHSREILEKIIPDAFTEKRKGLFSVFSRKKKEETIMKESVKEQPVTEESVTEETEKPAIMENTEKPVMTEDTEKTVITEDAEKMPKTANPKNMKGETGVKAYIKTGSEELDELLRLRIGTTDSLSESDAIIVSEIKNEEYMKEMANAGKKIILVIREDDTETKEKAERIGIKHIFMGSVNPNDIINIINNEQETTTKEEPIIKEEIQEPITAEPMIKEEIQEPVIQEPVIKEEIQEPVIKEEEKQTTYEETEEEIYPYHDALEQIKNILEENRKVYERRINTQQEIIDRKEKELQDAKDRIKELENIISEYRKKDEERKQIFTQLQKVFT
ncbi:MAG: AAA family ATPase [Thermoanaerobacteraceae bacterium]|nr:AAA family ATPase [Thermoanaerobacteraceae bacterium]